MKVKYLYLIDSSCYVPERFWIGVYLTENEFNKKYVNKRINPLPADLCRIKLSKTELIRYKNGKCLGDILDNFNKEV